MSLLQNIAQLERRVSMLEANRGSSLRFGTVTESNAQGSARVKLHDGENMVSMPVRTLHRRTLKDQDFCLPDLGEQVAVLFEGQGLEEGCILGAIYSDKDSAPDEEQHMEYYRFSDGTTIFYDREKHKFYAFIKGEAEIEIDKEALVKIKGEANFIVDENASIQSKKKLKLQGDDGISLRGPSIDWDGLEGQGDCEVEIKGKITHKGDLKRIGHESLEGDLSQTGNQNLKGNISATGKISGNPVEGCRH